MVLGASLVDVEVNTGYQYGYLPDYAIRSICLVALDICYARERCGFAMLVEPFEFYCQQQWCVLVVLETVQCRRGPDLLYKCYAIGLVHLELHLGEVGQVTF